MPEIPQICKLLVGRRITFPFRRLGESLEPTLLFSLIQKTTQFWIIRAFDKTSDQTFHASLSVLLALIDEFFVQIGVSCLGGDREPKMLARWSKSVGC